MLQRIQKGIVLLGLVSGSALAAPTVSLTAPAANTVYSMPATVTLTATVSPTNNISKVEFYQGTTLIGTDTTSPYSITWSNVAAGSYSLTAKATDKKNATGTSTAVPIVVNAPPTVALTSPAANQVETAPASFTLSANAADSTGTITQIEFYQGSTLIGTATSAPYTVTWSNVQAGNYTLTAQATDSYGAVTTSSAVAVIANAAPTVSLTAPANNASVIAPDTVTLQAEATDSDGTIAQVEFYEGANLLATVTTAPYSYAWSNAQPGSYTLFAKATDNHGSQTTSPAVNITVAANQAPTVTITAPTPGTSYTAPAGIHLTASAADADGSVNQVAFYNGSTLLTTLTTAPYAYDWTDVQPGTYQLTAQATDERGLTTTSAPLTLTVTEAIPQAYYIHTDQLDTPRAITNANNTVVWRWDSDPFGATPANEDPDGNSTSFEFNQRFPGQYADQETGLHYNYFRDYDPTTGRYIESDPIGLAANQFSTYAYVDGNSLSYSDSYGLAVYDDGSTRLPVGKIPGGGGGGRPGSINSSARSGASLPGGCSPVAKSSQRGAQNPKVAEAAARGRQMHKDYDYGPGFEKEVTLPSGKRVDAVNLQTREVVELKPNNLNAIRRGKKQVEGYRRELESTTGECWTCRVETYD